MRLLKGFRRIGRRLHLWCRICQELQGVNPPRTVRPGVIVDSLLQPKMTEDERRRQREIWQAWFDPSSKVTEILGETDDGRIISFTTSSPVSPGGRSTPVANSVSRSSQGRPGPPSQRSPAAQTGEISTARGPE